MAVREGRSPGPSYDTLAEGTVTGAISFVSQTFREMTDRTQLRTRMASLEEFYLGNIGTSITATQIQHNKKPSQSMLWPKSSQKKTETQQATGQLGIRGFFIAGHSCEYMKVTQAEKRRTDILRLRCIRFFKDGRELQHINPNLEYVDCMSITFEWQKKDESNNTVTQLASEYIIL